MSDRNIFLSPLGVRKMTFVLPLCLRQGSARLGWGATTAWSSGWSAQKGKERGRSRSKYYEMTIGNYSRAQVGGMFMLQGVARSRSRLAHRLAGKLLK